MNEETEPTITVAGRTRTLPEAFEVLLRYPRSTPPAFDFVGPGLPEQLTPTEVKRTRKINSRISNLELAFFVETADTAPWIDADSDLATADPDARLFSDMTDLYWHFAERAPKGVNVGKISKVLHLKMPHLYPILDRRVVDAYRPLARALRGHYPQLNRRRRTWLAVRDDLLAARSTGALELLRGRLRGFESADKSEQEKVRRLDQLTDVRLLDILVW